MPLTAPTEPVAGAEITGTAAAGAALTDFAGRAGDADGEPFLACAVATTVATAGAEMALGSADFVGPVGASTPSPNDGTDAGTEGVGPESVRRAVAAGAGVLLPASPDLLSTRFTRPERCAPVLVDDLVGAEAEADEPDDPETEEPEEPVVSANAVGIAATPEPTPKATASAPTRPT